METINAYCLPWHISRSGAFRDILVTPLAEYLHIELHGMEGGKLPAQSAADLRADRVQLICQVIPPDSLLRTPRARVVWVPMWDQVRLRPQSWWNTLPKSLKVVAYSDAIATRARAAGLRTLQVQYFVDPTRFSPAQHGGQRVAYYWNRSGLLSPAALTHFCQALQIDTLLFRSLPDPAAPARCNYTLPARLGIADVLDLPAEMPYADYQRLVNQANIVISPRSSEGVGLVMLEALARGCAIFAYDAPTMNEYIRHRENGYLFPAAPPSKLPSLAQRVLNRAEKALGKLYFTSPVTDNQRWDELATLDLPLLGAQAAADHLLGYRNWQQQLPAFAKFLLER